jgi:hypothetical protein
LDIRQGSPEAVQWPLDEREGVTLQRQDIKWTTIMTTLDTLPPYSLLRISRTKSVYRPPSSSGLGALRLINDEGVYADTDRVALPVHLQPYDLNPSGPLLPFAVVHMDLTGLSLPRTARGHTCILVVRNHFTRYVEISPIRRKTERCIPGVLLERIYLRNGSFSTVITDNGTEFVNKLSAQINDLLCIKHVTTTAYEYHHNGEVESHNRVLMNQLPAYCNEFHDDWDLHLQLCAFVYNTIPNTQTGYSPHFMLYGREASQSHSQWIESYTTTHPDKDTAHYTSELVQRL